jgi:hypothetical protein
MKPNCFLHKYHYTELIILITFLLLQSGIDHVNCQTYILFFELILVDFCVVNKFEYVMLVLMNVYKVAAD